MVCSLTAQVLAETPTHTDHTEGSVHVGTYACTSVGMEVGGELVFDRDYDGKKDRR